jgi:hypothetical protein
VGVGMAGVVVVVDRDPVETGGQIQFHLAHEATGEAAKVSYFSAIFRRDDEAKLMAIAAAALHKGLAVARRLGRFCRAWSTAAPHVSGLDNDHW